MSKKPSSDPQHPQPPPAEVNHPPRIDPPADDSAPVDPGLEELQRLAQEDPAAAGAAAAQALGYVPPPIEPRHHAMAQAYVTLLLGALEKGLPIQYSEKTRAEAIEATVPMVAKYENDLPLFLVKYQAEISFSIMLAGLVSGTYKGVKHANALEEEVKQLAQQYRDRDGLTIRDAYRRARREVAESAAAAADTQGAD